MGVEVGDTVSGRGGETILRESSPPELNPCACDYPDPRCVCPAALPTCGACATSLCEGGCGRGVRRGHPMLFRTSVLTVRVQWAWVIYLATAIMIVPTSDAVLNMGNPDAKRLYDDLLSNYNKLVRPVQNTTDPLTVRIKLKLSQLIDVVSLIFLLMQLASQCG